eukprot:1160545-Pelagomonas_calceolata.AAC.17
MSDSIGAGAAAAANQLLEQQAKRVLAQGGLGTGWFRRGMDHFQVAPTSANMWTCTGSNKLSGSIHCTGACPTRRSIIVQPTDTIYSMETCVASTPLHSCALLNPIPGTRWFRHRVVRAWNGPSQKLEPVCVDAILYY